MIRSEIIVRRLLKTLKIRACSFLEYSVDGLHTINLMNSFDFAKLIELKVINFGFVIIHIDY